MTFTRAEILRAGAEGSRGDANDFQVAADQFLSEGDEPMALAALDRAHGLAPGNAEVATMRASLLDRQAITEHGIAFRYVPAGTFLMGSRTGDPDERPVHPVRVDGFWIADVPLSWDAYCRLSGWHPPPAGQPQDKPESAFYLAEANKIRRRYCETDTMRGRDWTAYTYDRKPMVAVGWDEAEALAQALSSDAIEYALPTEAEWEKAARGGLIGKRYAWGDEAPTPARCDFDNFGAFSIVDPRALPANGYGVHAMCGGVWEWTATVYDALAYVGLETPAIDAAIYERSRRDPPPGDEPQQRVLRGGSWSDNAAAVTVSFRSAGVGLGWQTGWSDAFTPNVGFRLVRRVAVPEQ